MPAVTRPATAARGRAESPRRPPRVVTAHRAHRCGCPARQNGPEPATRVPPPHPTGRGSAATRPASVPPRGPAPRGDRPMPPLRLDHEELRAGYAHRSGIQVPEPYLLLA